MATRRTLGGLSRAAAPRLHPQPFRRRHRRCEIRQRVSPLLPASVEIRDAFVAVLAAAWRPVAALLHLLPDITPPVRGAARYYSLLLGSRAWRGRVCVCVRAGHRAVAATAAGGMAVVPRPVKVTEPRYSIATRPRHANVRRLRGSGARRGGGRRQLTTSMTSTTTPFARRGAARRPCGGRAVAVRGLCAVTDPDPAALASSSAPHSTPAQKVAACVCAGHKARAPLWGGDTLERMCPAHCSAHAPSRWPTV